MKKLGVFILSVLTAPAVMAQGGVLFQDLISPDTYEGQNVGSDFSVELWYGPEASDPGTFVVVPSSQVSYLGTTGGSPGTDGAGTFNLGLVSVPGQPGGTVLTMQVRSATPGFVILSGNNPFDITLAGGAPFPTIPNQSFTFVPEPSAFALSLFGAGVLCAFRRRS